MSNPYRTLTAAELEEFGAEMDAIRQRIIADLGEADAEYLRKVVKAQRGFEVAGRVLFYLPPLWPAAVASLGREGARVIRCWLPGVHPYRAALLAAGFAPEGLVATHHFRPMQLAADSLEPLRDPSTPIHLMLGDSDTV